MRLVVVGAGYVGLVTSVTLAHIGHDVIVVDIDDRKIEQLKNNNCPIYEPNLNNLLIKNKKRLHFTTDYKSTYKNSDIIMICVGTPENLDGSVDLSQIYLVCNQIASCIEHDCTIIIKSTVPVGTCENIEQKLNDMLQNKQKIFVASNPEFLSQGTAIKDSLYATRIVVGVNDIDVSKTLEKIYKPLTQKPYNIPYICTSIKNSEMIKYVSNGFLSLKLSYINEIANLCEKVGTDIEEIVKGIQLDPRIGSAYLKAGIGYGGSCLPKDTKALYNMAKKEGLEMKTIRAATEVNESQQILLVKKIKDDFKGNLKNKNISILGLTFKAGTDDVRHSPALINTQLLINSGANVKVYDPVGENNFKINIEKIIDKELIKKRIMFYSEIEETIKDSDAIMILTDWSEIINFIYAKIKKGEKIPKIYDGRNCLKKEFLKNVNYTSIGR